VLKRANDGKYTVLVTGATGFIGRHVCEYLHSAGFQVRVAVRTSRNLPEAWRHVEIGDIGPETSWDIALAGVECIVHLASYSPAPGANAAEVEAAYRRVNVEGSERLARAAAEAGIRRLIYVSTVKVNGEVTVAEEAFTAAMPPRPRDIYGKSKWRAEQIVREIGADSALETVTLRLPLVYGPQVRGNYLALLRLVERGLPVPLRCVRNRRSMLYVKNLAHAIGYCLDAPGARGQIYLLSDGEDLSTPDLIKRIGVCMGHPARLWPVPVVMLRGAGYLFGKRAMVERLTGSLRVDSNKIREQIAWTPPFSVDEGLRATVKWYLSARGNRL
jgi:UDP-N-acetyl-alpha-D-quinovosamine dehydrogenase